MVSHYFGHRLPLSMEKTKYDSLMDTMADYALDICEILFFESGRVHNDCEPKYFTRYQLRKIARFFSWDDHDYFDKIEEA